MDGDKLIINIANYLLYEHMRYWSNQKGYQIVKTVIIHAYITL